MLEAGRVIHIQLWARALILIPMVNNRPLRLHVLRSDIMVSRCKYDGHVMEVARSFHDPTTCPSEEKVEKRKTYDMARRPNLKHIAHVNVKNPILSQGGQVDVRRTQTIND